MGRLKWIIPRDNIKIGLDKQGLKMWNGFVWTRTGLSDGCYEGSNERSVSLKCCEFLYRLRHCWLHKDTVLSFYMLQLL
jgi:hypothetical protein